MAQAAYTVHLEFDLTLTYSDEFRAIPTLEWIESIASAWIEDWAHGLKGDDADITNFTVS